MSKRPLNLSLLQTGSISVCGQELSGDDLSVVYTTGSNNTTANSSAPAAGNQPSTTKGKSKSKTSSAVASKQTTSDALMQRYEAASDSRGLLVLLDTKVDAELEDERLARELVNRIQRTRKKVGYSILYPPPSPTPTHTVLVITETIKHTLRFLLTGGACPGRSSCGCGVHHLGRSATRGAPANQRIHRTHSGHSQTAHGCASKPSVVRRH